MAEFKLGVYRHFKGGLYYAACVAESSEGIGGPEVVYYSYEQKHWRRRPLTSPVAWRDCDRHGFLDVIDRPGYKGPRFTLLFEHGFVSPPQGGMTADILTKDRTAVLALLEGCLESESVINVSIRKRCEVYDILVVSSGADLPPAAKQTVR